MPHTKSQLKVSVITPSVRPEGLAMVGKCLRRQTLTEFEWIIIAPERLFNEIKRCLTGFEYKLVAEPAKRDGDYYRLSGAFNAGFTQAQGKLIVSIVDYIWFPPDTLERFWSHFVSNPKLLVTTVGHQYEEIDQYGVPSMMVWRDPRSRSDFGTFYEVAPTEMEMCVASIPKQAVLDCGGIDEEYDRGAAVGEKEMCYRLDHLGYKFYIDQTLEYKAFKHPRLNTEWDEKYKVSSQMFLKHLDQLKNGERKLNVGYVQS